MADQRSVIADPLLQEAVQRRAYCGGKASSLLSLLIGLVVAKVLSSTPSAATYEHPALNMAYQNIQPAKTPQLLHQARVQQVMTANGLQPTVPVTVRPFTESSVSMTPAARRAIIAAATKAEEEVGEEGKGAIGTALDLLFLPTKLAQEFLQGAGKAANTNPDNISATIVGINALLFFGALGAVLVKVFIK